MRIILTKYYDLLNNRALWQRIVILLVFLLILFGFWYGLYWQRLQKHKAALAFGQQRAQKEVQILQTNLNSLRQSIVTREQKREQLASLKQKQKLKPTASKILPEFDEHIVPASEMVPLLKRMLAANSGLDLLSAENLPAQVLGLPNSKYKLYQYAVVLNIRGNYFAILNYLHKLEQLPRHLFWDSVSFKVVAYPESELELQVHTLSEAKGLMHV